MERSQKYDWFKGPQSANPKDQWKKRGKIFWRFTKIFSVFSVLFLTLWGCGQTFGIKSDSHVGRAVEIYQSEKDIAPHITKFNIVADRFNIPGAVNSTPTIYSATYDQNSNIWLEKEKDGSKDMEDVYNEITTNQKRKMSDAYKGVNEAISVSLTDNGVGGGNKSTIPLPTIGRDGKNNPIVMSSTTSDSRPSFQTQSDSDRLGNILVQEKNNIKLLANLNDVSWNWNITIPDDNTFTNLVTDKQVSRMDFKTALYNYIGTISVPNKPQPNNWILDALTLQNDYSFPIGANIPATGTLRERYDAIVNAQQSAISVLSYLGFEINSKHELVAHLDSMPGEGGTTYRPIVTWGQAWVRGVGPFYGLVVYPVSWLFLHILNGFPFMSGWESLLSIVFIVLILRILAFSITFKSTMQQTKMQELNLKKASIDAKYASFKDNKQMQARKNQEIQEMYRKEGVNTFSPFVSLIITMPIFLSVWRMIAAIPHLKSTIWLKINFSATSWQSLFKGEVQYLPLMVTALALTLLSSYYGRLLVKKRDKIRGNAHMKTAMKKSDRTQIIVIIISAFISLVFTAGVQIYSIVVSLWVIFQTHLTHHLLIRSSRKRKEQGMAAKGKG